MTEREKLRSAVGQQAPPEGPRCSTSGASHTFIEYHSKYLAGGFKKKQQKNPHGDILFNYSITQMETVITWKLRTSQRGVKCDPLSDGGELELIGSRCGCVEVTCISAALVCEPRIIQLHVRSRPDGYISTQIKNIWCPM